MATAGCHAGAPARSREEAVRLGVTRFANGKPCPAGHVAERYTLSSACVVCQRLNAQAQRLKVKGGRLRVLPGAVAQGAP